MPISKYGILISGWDHYKMNRLTQIWIQHEQDPSLNQTCIDAYNYNCCITKFLIHTQYINVTVFIQLWNEFIVAGVLNKTLWTTGQFFDLLTTKIHPIGKPSGYFRSKSIECFIYEGSIESWWLSGRSTYLLLSHMLIMFHGANNFWRILISANTYFQCFRNHAT